MDAIEFIEGLFKDQRKVGIFSCEDPYNTPFHADLYNISNGYLHFVPRAGGIVVPESLDLGLQAKGINAWGIFGHFGNVHNHEVCAAIKLLGGDYSNLGDDFKGYLDRLKLQFRYDNNKSLKENIIAWIALQYEILTKTALEKQKTLKGAVNGNIVTFGGIVYNSEDGKSYKSDILFKNM